MSIVNSLWRGSSTHLSNPEQVLPLGLRDHIYPGTAVISGRRKFSSCYCADVEPLSDLYLLNSGHKSKGKSSCRYCAGWFCTALKEGPFYICKLQKGKEGLPDYLPDFSRGVPVGHSVQFSKKKNNQETGRNKCVPGTPQGLSLETWNEWEHVVKKWQKDYYYVQRYCTLQVLFLWRLS